MGCVNSIKTVLKNQNGVITVEATLEPPQTTIQYDPGKTTLAQLEAAIIDAGFEVVD